MPGPFGADILEGLRMAGDVNGDVQSDLRTIADDGRIKVLQGDERKQFFSGMTQGEFNMLHDIAMSMGPRGLNALERMMREGYQQYEESK